MGPRDVAVVQGAAKAGKIVPVAFSRAGVHQFTFPPADDLFDAHRILRVIQIAQHDEVYVGISGETRLNLFAKDLGLLLAEFGFVRLGNRALGFQVGSNDRKGIVRVDLDVCFGEPAAYVKTTAIEQKVVVGMRSESGKWEFAENGEVDIGVKTGDMVPVGEIKAFGFE